MVEQCHQPTQYSAYLLSTLIPGGVETLSLCHLGQLRLGEPRDLLWSLLKMNKIACMEDHSYIIGQVFETLRLSCYTHDAEEPMLIKRTRNEQWDRFRSCHSRYFLSRVFSFFLHPLELVFFVWGFPRLGTFVWVDKVLLSVISYLSCLFSMMMMRHGNLLTSHKRAYAIGMLPLKTWLVTILDVGCGSNWRVARLPQLEVVCKYSSLDKTGLL